MTFAGSVSPADSFYTLPSLDMSVLLTSETPTGTKLELYPVEKSPSEYNTGTIQGQSWMLSLPWRKLNMHNMQVILKCWRTFFVSLQAHGTFFPWLLHSNPSYTVPQHVFYYYVFLFVCIYISSPVVPDPHMCTVFWCFIFIFDISHTYVLKLSLWEPLHKSSNVSELLVYSPMVNKNLESL